MVGSIVIAGDENRQAFELKDALKKSTNFSVTVLPAAPTLLKSLTQRPPDLIVLNPKGLYVEMMDTYYAIRKEPSLQDTPIVLMFDESQMRSADLPSGIQEILIRPIRPVEAVLRIELLYKRYHRIDQKNMIERGKLTIDVSRYEVRIGERKIDLTFTELELLKFLCANPGTVFTREVLLNKVWGYEYYGGTRTVDVHIRRLRSKIENKSDQFIETVRNIGYKFIYNEK